MATDSDDAVIEMIRGQLTSLVESGDPITNGELDALNASVHALSDEGHARLARVEPEFGALLKRNVEAHVLAMASFLGQITLHGEDQYDRFRGRGVEAFEAKMREDASRVRREVPPEDADRAAGQSEWLSVTTASWFECGLPRVVLGHKHAASLMATHVAPELLGEIRPPWPVFVADIPPGLIEWRFENGTVEPLAHLFVAVFETEFRIVAATHRAAVAWLEGRTLKQALAAIRKDPIGALIARYAVGVCIEATQHRPVRQHAHGGRADVKRDARGLPRTRVFKLARNVLVDCRDAVRAYARGEKRGALSLQHFVRGHWKMQRCGALGLDRKFIHIEPYWRGPEDAPIALRSHVLGEARDD